MVRIAIIMYDYLQVTVEGIEVTVEELRSWFEMEIKGVRSSLGKQTQLTYRIYCSFNCCERLLVAKYNFICHT